jgi:alpha-tubulin suppressor-like RCC1 family protein
MEDVEDISAGYGHSLILKTDGTVWACGNNESGQLGDGTISYSRAVPVQVLSDVQSISTHGTVARYPHALAHSLFLKTDGTLWASGYNQYGQLGDGAFEDRATPVRIMSDVGAAWAGTGHTLILKTDSTLWGCGYNGAGELGDGTTSDHSVPVQIMSDVMAASAGGGYGGGNMSYGFSLVMRTDGTRWSFGGNARGELGDGTTVNRQTPVQVTF